MENQSPNSPPAPLLLILFLALGICNSNLFSSLCIDCNRGLFLSTCHVSCFSGVGRTGFSLSATINTNENKIGVELYLDGEQAKNRFKQLKDNQNQITSMLEGVIKRGTGRKLRNLNLNLAGKTGTTNKNMDAWFLGFTSKLVIGVYVGFDEPQSLGRYETGAKAALPIFKKFVENVVKKRDALPFRIPKNIKILMVDVETGLPRKANTKKVIYESFKLTDNFIVGLEKSLNKDKLELYDSENEKSILRFY